jgi:hypothetical protein
MLLTSVAASRRRRTLLTCRAGQPLGAAALRDITTGGNATAAAGGYKAAVGFDAVTGWGSPNGANLMKLL